ncbi:hypothetical protein BJV78DRAFT_1286030 [Lactifluus subvellereus]|nr:hypothetical protein BJV78DRAFT_1286030 [Lactifluus subvellereus]
MYIIVIVLSITRTIDTPFLFVQFYTAVLQPHTRGDSLRDTLKHASDCRCGGIPIPKGAIRSYERRSQGDIQSPVDRPSARTFGINERNLDLESEPTHSPRPRHVPGTPYPQQRHLYSSDSTQLEQQLPPTPSLSRPVSAPPTPMYHPVATAPPLVSIPHQTMAAYQVPLAPSGQFYQQPQRPSPFAVPTPLMSIPGVVATPLGPSLPLPSSWAPATPQVSAAYVPSPATSSQNFQAAALAPGFMGWPPHSQPQLGTPAAAFWPTPSIPTTPFTPGQTMALPGGLPIPGTQPFWTPGEPWPPRERTLPLHLAPWLAPNPVSADRPHVVWDISDPPSKAKRISGQDIFVDMNDAFSSHTPAVFPETNEIIVVCNTGFGQDMWPPIKIRKNKVTCGDVFWAIYQYFQKPVSCDEVDIIKGRSEDEYRRLLEACYRRCSRTPGLAEITRRQGVKRVDCLEDRTAWWGMWPVWAMDGTWSLHLGLMASSRA